MKDYLKKIGMKLEALQEEESTDVFRLGDISYMSLGIVKFPIYLKNFKGEIIEKEVECHLIERDIVILLGNNTIKKEWKLILDSSWNRFGIRPDGN